MLHEHTVYSAVDAKPKSTFDLRRLKNIQSNRTFSLLVDHYNEDWTTLWWIRIDGHGRVVADDRERGNAIGLLATKYAQYRDTPPPGPVLALGIERWIMWP